ncbi:helix-turn-helix domain-containing protein [Oceanicoccus sagamiensis]|uniref:helix-turn-helix domain-containing protein n=1 Tax=Oceanicoccus sagamiensis TaxID=716816 RepID=UPI0012F4DA26
MILSEILAENLKARRGKLTQAEFARKLGGSRATLTRLENAGGNFRLQGGDFIS